MTPPVAVTSWLGFGPVEPPDPTHAWRLVAAAAVGSGYTLFWQRVT